VAASSASAKLPEWGRCEASEQHQGRFADAGCTQPVKKVYGRYTGGYEWRPLSEPEPIEEPGEVSGLDYRTREIPQPSAESTIVFGNGDRIKCSIPLFPETQIRLTGPHMTTEAPYVEFGGCVDERTGGECNSTDEENFEAGIGDATAWRHGLEQRGPSWTGTMAFISGKHTAEPAVGLVYKTENSKERFLQQIVCSARGGGEPLTIAIGGRKAGEELTMAITPVNAMSESFTASMVQSAGVQGPTSLEGKPTKTFEALVNAHEWQTVGFEASLLFTETYLGPIHEHDQGGNETELELKATP